jgi:hypothetical protein
MFFSRWSFRQPSRADCLRLVFATVFAALADSFSAQPPAPSHELCLPPRQRFTAVSPPAARLQTLFFFRARPPSRIRCCLPSEPDYMSMQRPPLMPSAAAYTRRHDEAAVSAAAAASGCRSPLSAAMHLRYCCRRHAEILLAIAMLLLQIPSMLHASSACRDKITIRRQFPETVCPVSALFLQAECRPDAPFHREVARRHRREY